MLQQFFQSNHIDVILIQDPSQVILNGQGFLQGYLLFQIILTHQVTLAVPSWKLSSGHRFDFNGSPLSIDVYLEH